ncbi:MAG: 4-deoxy-4-formamido-L-arabinose-phosphoundecaprenol deformylase [Elusimicrobia bacterium]|nr:4-deoxy-4-formamido-L-arabinose-phosphoundecaprenol deformylase [Elusimicrobiota bacterium]
MHLTLKVDVDTYDGMEKGVPRLLQIFRDLAIKVSFFIPFGPDESGKAIFRVFRKKGFLKKMFRTNALQLYGPKTILRGTLLPAPKIGASFPNIVHSILEEGHEIGIHGYNHVLWQDHLLEMKEGEVKKQFELGMQEYENVVGKKPRSFAAPGWICSSLSLKMLDSFGFDYASDTRLGQFPFYPTFQGNSFKTLQIPSTLPTLDEILGTGRGDAENVHDTLTEILLQNERRFNVHTIHTEVEGMALLSPFSQWLHSLRNKQTQFLTCEQIFQTVLKEPQNNPHSEIVLSEIPGRAGPVACQKE